MHGRRTTGVWCLVAAAAALAAASGCELIAAIHDRPDAGLDAPADGAADAPADASSSPDAADDAPPAPDAADDALAADDAQSDGPAEAGCTPDCGVGKQCCSTNGYHCRDVSSPQPGTGKILFVLAQAACEAACTSTCGKGVGQQPSVRYRLGNGAWFFVGLALDDTCPYYFAVQTGLDSGAYVYQFTCSDDLQLFRDPGNSSCTGSCSVCPTTVLAADCYNTVTVP